MVTLNRNNISNKKSDKNNDCTLYFSFPIKNINKKLGTFIFSKNKEKILSASKKSDILLKFNIKDNPNFYIMLNYTKKNVQFINLEDIKLFFNKHYNNKEIVSFHHMEFNEYKFNYDNINSISNNSKIDFNILYDDSINNKPYNLKVLKTESFDFIQSSNEKKENIININSFKRLKEYKNELNFMFFYNQEEAVSECFLGFINGVFYNKFQKINEHFFIIPEVYNNYYSFNTEYNNYLFSKNSSTNFFLKHKNFEVKNKVSKNKFIFNFLIFQTSELDYSCIFFEEDFPIKYKKKSLETKI